AQRLDITEELDRLKTHIAEVLRVLKQQEPIGRRLDFLMQELNREANTLGSKSMDKEMTQIAIELKVLIEQMREQIQNIE
ncbi:MAG: endoribonuclease YicC domain-containing protein, partial [Methylococcaceae bacterium]